MRTKYKNMVLVALCALLVVAATPFVAATTMNPFSPSKAAADPVATCNTKSGATLKRTKNNENAYCSCPKGEVLVGETETCVKTCPKGQSPQKATSSNPQSYCDKTTASGSSSSSPSCGSADNQAVCQPYNAKTNPTGIRTDNCATKDGDCACKAADSCDIVTTYIDPFIKFLSVAVGVVSVASITYGGIQYSMSAGDPQKVSAAKGRIFKTITALIAYAFLFGFLQFLVPGGLFNR